ncbi:MAG: hypothetical protein E6G46_06745 [Actinobacteria bacterium]|nr:MAG: hypothetical protein E6G46_06745 [Actinomycetota bacterium]
MARTDVTPAQRLDDAFAERTNALVMPFLVCGYPDGDTFVDIAAAAAEAGGGVLEIGIPFSDPIMDGPVIQEATNALLAKGQRTAGAIELIARAAEATGRPLVAMTYYNLIFRYGLDAFARALADAGAGSVARRMRARRYRAGVHRGANVHARAASRDRGGRARLRVRGVAPRRHRGARVDGRSRARAGRVDPRGDRPARCGRHRRVDGRARARGGVVRRRRHRRQRRREEDLWFEQPCARRRRLRIGPGQSRSFGLKASAGRSFHPSANGSVARCARWGRVRFSSDGAERHAHVQAPRAGSGQGKGRAHGFPRPVQRGPGRAASGRPAALDQRARLEQRSARRVRP